MLQPWSNAPKNTKRHIQRWGGALLATIVATGSVSLGLSLGDAPASATSPARATTLARAVSTATAEPSTPSNEVGYFGSAENQPTVQNIVSMVSTPDGSGYWEIAADGAIYSYGSAEFFGAASTLRLASPIVDSATTPGGRGYWMTAGDGGVFSYGDAAFHGSAGDIRLNQPVVGMASTPSGKGYWQVARDGGIFSYGDAIFRGSTGGMPLNRPIVAMAATPSGKGYRLVASDGGVFSFGDAKFLGSAVGVIPHLDAVTSIASTDSGNGYYLLTRNGGVYSYGDAEFHGAATGMLDSDAVALATTAQRRGYYVVSRRGRVHPIRPRKPGVPNPGTQPPSGGINSLALIASDQRGFHEGVIPLPDGYSWKPGPEIQVGNDNAGMQSAVTWGVLFADGLPQNQGLNPGTGNTRVQVRAVQCWLLSKSTGKWILVTSGAEKGDAYREDFGGNVSNPMSVRTESEGVSGKLDFSAGRNAWHFWAPRGTIPANDVAAVYGTFQARLILDNPNGPDDRAFWSQHLLAGSGIDYWASLSANWPNNRGASIGKFKFVTNEWAAFNTTTATPAQLSASPPPL